MSGAMGVKVITPATAQLTLAEMRLHLRLDESFGTDDNLMLLAMLASAVDYCEHYTGRSIGAQTLEIALDAFPACGIVLPNGPVTAITSITYTNVSQLTLAPAAYVIDDYGLQTSVLPKAYTQWPATDGTLLGIKIRYVAGGVRPAVRSALLLMVAHLYENREATNIGRANTDQELPYGVTSLLNTCKVWTI